jgi:hypothetical protein
MSAKKPVEKTPAKETEKTVSGKKDRTSTKENNIKEKRETTSETGNCKNNGKYWCW